MRIVPGVKTHTVVPANFIGYYVYRYTASKESVKRFGWPDAFNIVVPSGETWCLIGVLCRTTIYPMPCMFFITVHAYKNGNLWVAGGDGYSVNDYTMFNQAYFARIDNFYLPSGYYDIAFEIVVVLPTIGDIELMGDFIFMRMKA